MTVKRVHKIFHSEQESLMIIKDSHIQNISQNDQPVFTKY